jgi:hypothetical protein
MSMKDSSARNSFGSGSFWKCSINCFFVLSSITDLKYGCLILCFRDQAFSLQIVGTSLQTLGLSSLSQIRFGSIAIVDNSNLCHVSSVNWSKIVANWNNKISNSSRIVRNGASAVCSKFFFSWRQLARANGSLMPHFRQVD